MAEVAVRFSETTSMVNGNGAVVDDAIDKEFVEFIGGDQSTTNGNSNDENNSNGTNGVNLPGGNERLKWKIKRPSAAGGYSKFQLSRTNSDSSVCNGPARGMKNSRKSRSVFGRGLPKKGGAGGKGTWGKLGSEVLDEIEDTGAMDPNDPNYDDQNLDTVKLKVTEVSPRKKEYPDEEICKLIHTIVLEYYNHGDSEECYLAFEELPWSDSQRPLLVVTAVEAAMDHKPSHREMTSVLLADLYSHSLDEEHYSKGYDLLIKNLPDLVIDTPDAPTFLGNFIARSIADDCIPPKFLTGYKGQVESEISARCLHRSESLLSMRHGLVRLDAVWGVGGGTRPVKHLVKKMNLLLHEYLSSNDIKEAERCLVELEVPHFHHELVYEAVVLGLEKMDERSTNLICKLLASLHASVIITPNQMKEGFIRVFDDLPQITLDVPPAHVILEKFVIKCQKEKIIGDDVVRKMPTRARKRFVSEGDGGRIKDDLYF